MFYKCFIQVFIVIENYFKWMQDKFVPIYDLILTLNKWYYDKNILVPEILAIE